MNSPSEVLFARGVSAGYGGRDVLRGIDLCVRSGEMVAVLGPNGAGKSTLVGVLSGLLAPSAGSVELRGEPLSGLSRADVARSIAVVRQHSEVALGFRVGDVVMMGRAPHQGAWMRSGAADHAAVGEALAACDLVALADRPVAELSGGEQRRVAVARALAQRGDVLLLDEPTAHLDVRHALDLLAVLRREIEARQVGCLLVLHDLNLAAAYADRIVLMKNGGIQADGAPLEVIARDVLEAVFEAPLFVGEHADRGVRYVVPAPGSRRAKGSDL